MQFGVPFRYGMEYPVTSGILFVSVSGGDEFIVILVLMIINHSEAILLSHS